MYFKVYYQLYIYSFKYVYTDVPGNFQKGRKLFSTLIVLVLPFFLLLLALLNNRSKLSAYAF